MMKQQHKLSNMILAALFLALSFVMPFLTGQIPEVGAMLCPLHVPVLLCGFFCGGAWGAVVGFLAPLLRSFVLGMPPLFPTAVCMAFELCVYGFVAGFLHRNFFRKKICIYASLLLSMIAGRLVWGAAMLVCMGMSGGSFGFAAFFAGAITNAIPGIVLQLVFIPVAVMLFDRKSPSVSGDN